jgi:hypothetical protein
MTEVTDAYMQEQLTKSREYSVVLLKAAKKYGQEGSDAVIWEHGRRNFILRDQGLLSIVCPVIDDTELCGIGIRPIGDVERRVILVVRPERVTFQ